MKAIHTLLKQCFMLSVILVATGPTPHGYFMHGKSLGTPAVTLQPTRSAEMQR